MKRTVSLVVVTVMGLLAGSAAAIGQPEQVQGRLGTVYADSGHNAFPAVVRGEDGPVVVFRQGPDHFKGGSIAIATREEDGWTTRTAYDTGADNRSNLGAVRVGGQFVIPGVDNDKRPYLLTGDGSTWERRNLPGTYSPYGRILKSGNGLVVPAYRLGKRGGDNASVSGVLHPRRNGWTFARIGKGLNETSIVRGGPGFIAVARSINYRNEDRRWTRGLYQTRFRNGAWLEPRRVVGPGAVSPDLVRVSHNTLYLTYADRTKGQEGIYRKVSRNNGRTWGLSRTIYRAPRKSWDFGYPSTIRLRNGRMLTVFYDEEQNIRSFVSGRTR